jgi:poly [ADP-ribose] polymerase 10/14/15
VDLPQSQVPQPSEEYDFVFTRFVASLATLPVIHRIIRVQAPRLWAHYARHKGHISNEMWLFHGTQPDSVEKIVAEGFNRSFAGYNATAYGEGCYFAKNSSYSIDYAGRRKNGGDGHRFMFLARALIGTFTKGEKGMKTSPPGFDSVVNRILRPHIHVVFQDQQAYPAYIIEFS